MLTTIQEDVTVGRDGVIQLHTHGFEYNSRLSVVAVIEKEDLIKRVKNPKVPQCDLNPFFELAGQVDIDSDAIYSLREESLI